MKKFLEEFKAFALKGNVMDMAIGVIIGGAFAAITGSLVSDVITPILAVLFKSPNTDALNITLRAASEVAEKLAKKQKEEEAAAAPAEPSAEEKLLTEIRDLLKEQKK